MTVLKKSFEDLNPHLDSEDEEGSLVPVEASNRHSSNEPLWLRKHASHCISEFSDVSKVEQGLLIQWNNFIYSGGCRGTGKETLCCKTMESSVEKFIKVYGNKILNEGLRSYFICLLQNIINFGQLPVSSLLKFVRQLDRVKS